MTKDEELAMDLALEALEQGIDGQTSIQMDKAITAIKQARSAPVQEPVAWTNWRELAGARHYRTPGWEMYADKRNPDDVALYITPPAQPALMQEPVAFNAGVPPLYPEMKDGETISVEYTTPPAQPAPVQEPVALPCCGYTDASAVKWNPFNGVVQCHNCGQTYATSAAQAQEPDAFDCGVYLGKGKDHAIKHHVSYQPAPVQDAFAQLMRDAEKTTPVPESIAKYAAALVAGTHEITSLTIQPKRQWVGLTDEEEDAAFEQSMAERPKDASNKETRRLYARAIEAKLRSKNNG